MFRILSLLSLVFVWLGTSSCAITRPSDVNEEYREVLDQRHNHYKLKDGDTVTIEFYGTGEGGLNQTEVLVLPDGRSDFFFLDNQKLAGLTIAEFEAVLRERVVGREVRDSDISVLVAPRDEKVYMVGQFVEPDAVDLTTQLTLQTAISAVGGFKITGDSDWALLRRPYGRAGNPALYRIDLNDESADIFLLPEDQIVLGRTFLAGMINYVREYLFELIPSFPLAIPL